MLARCPPTTEFPWLLRRSGEGYALIHSVWGYKKLNCATMSFALLRQEDSVRQLSPPNGRLHPYPSQQGPASVIHFLRFCQPESVRTGLPSTIGTRGRRLRFG